MGAGLWLALPQEGWLCRSGTLGGVEFAASPHGRERCDACAVGVATATAAVFKVRVAVSSPSLTEPQLASRTCAMQSRKREREREEEIGMDRVIDRETRLGSARRSFSPRARPRAQFAFLTR